MFKEKSVASVISSFSFNKSPHTFLGLWPYFSTYSVVSWLYWPMGWQKNVYYIWDKKEGEYGWCTFYLHMEHWNLLKSF
jgi:hypothetical protein